MRANNQCNKYIVSLTKRKTKCSTKQIIIYIIFAFANIFENFYPYLERRRLEYESDVKARINTYGEIKSFQLMCNINHIENINEIIKTIILHTKKSHNQKISMIISDRNTIKLHTIGTQLLLLDFIYKSFSNKKDIFAENLFIIYDIAQIDEKYR